MNIELLMALTLIHLVALSSPGPDFALVVKLASQESRQVAISAAGGIAIAVRLFSMDGDWCDKISTTTLA